MTATYTFKVCDAATGIPTAFVPQFSAATCSIEFSDVGSLGFNYLKTGVNYALLDAFQFGPVELAVFQNGVELDDGRFRIQSATDDELDPDESTKFTCVSLANRLKFALTYSADGSLTLGVDQVFTGTAGGILKALFDQNAARGANRVMDQITYASFNAVTDSAGAAWAFTLADITYTVGTNYLDVLRNMVNNGMIEFKMVGRDLRVYNAGTMGVDRTAIAEPIVLRKGRDLTEAPRTRTIEQVAAIGLIAGNEGILKQIIDTSVQATWGADEVYISQGGISDDATLGILVAQELERRSQVRIENTHKVALQASPYQPGIDYGVSDYIFTDRGKGPERLRIRQMVMDIDPGAVTYASIVLNDRFLEKEIAIARRVDGILGGATSTGSVAIPAEPAPGEDLTTPKDPTSLTTIPTVYVDSDNRSQVAIALSWPAVTQNTDGSTISDLDHYETSYKFDSVDATVPSSAFGPARDENVYNKLFDRRGLKPFGWVSGDGGASARVSSGKDFWAFSNSWIGQASGIGNTTPGSTYVNNALVLTDPAVPATFDSRYGMGNLLSANDAFLESTVGLWQADTNCSVARDTTAFWYGAASLKLTATAAGTCTARIAAPATSNYPVTAGKTYSVMAKAKTLSGTARNVQIGIRWYNASNALLSTSISASSAGLTTGWVRYNLADQAPVGAVKAAMIVQFVSAAAAQVFNVDTMGLFDGDMKMASWVDPNRNVGNKPVSLVNVEDLGGAQIASGSLAGSIWNVDEIIEASGKVLCFLGRYNSSGVFQNSTAIAQWDGTTHNFDGVFAFSSSDVVQWGSALFLSGGTLFVYGWDSSDAATAQDMFLMRIPGNNPIAGTKEYMVNVGAATWSTTRASAVSVYTGNNNRFGNVDFVGSVYNSIVTILGSGQLRRLTAPFLQGPWTDTGPIYTQPNVGGGVTAYVPRLHPQLYNNSGVLMSWSVNGGVNGDVKNYSPKFARGPVSVQAALTPLTDWSPSRVVPSGTLTDNISPIPSNWNFQARVRALDSSGHASIWRESSPIRTPSDVTPPNRPSAPILSAQFQGIRAEWDGLDYLGGPAPGDWSRMEVHLSKIANFTPGPGTLVDTFVTRLGGVSPIQGLDYGTTYYVRFIAIDIRENRSDASDASALAPQQLVNTAEIGAKLIQGANIADQTIAVRSITVAAFEPSIVPNGGFEDDATNADGSSTGLPSFWQPTIWTIGGGATVAYDTATPLAGNRSLKMTMATDADGLRYASAKFPVTEGRLLAVSMKVRASRAIANPAFEIHVVCGNTEANTGAFPSAGVSVWGSSATAIGTTAVQKVELQRIVDSGMKWAQVYVTCLNAADGGGGWVGTIDEVNCQPVGGSAYIADASILNAKIANLAVDNAKISNMSVGKLTAGILSADMTVSARIKTADSGARVELNSAGLQAYNSAGTQTVNIAAATGAATITGQFQTDFPTSTTPHVEMKNSGDRTTIYFTDNSGAGTNYAYLNTPLDASNVPRIGLNTGLFTLLGVTDVRQRLFLSTVNGISLEAIGSTGRLGFGLDMSDSQMYLRRTIGTGNLLGGSFEADSLSWTARRYGTGASIDGGQVQGDSNNLYLEAYDVGTVGGRIVVNGDEQIYMAGRFVQDFAQAGKAALFVGNWSAGSATSYTVNYGVTMATRPQPIYAIHASGSPGDHRLNGFNTTSFTVQTATAVASNINYWAFRTNP